LDYGEVGKTSPATFNIVLLRAQISVSFDIAIIDDNLQEENETFSMSVILDSGCLPITINGDSITTITIVDNEGTILPLK